MVYFKLALRTLSHEKARSISAVIGIAGSVALLAWHLALASTVASQGTVAATRATAPYVAWMTGSTRSRQQVDAQAITSANSRATAEATVGFRRKSVQAQPLPEELIQKLSSATDLVKPVFANLQTGSIDVRPNGRVMQGPPLIGMITALPSNQKPLFENEENLEQGRWPQITPNSTIHEAVFNVTIFEERVNMIPALGTEIPIILKSGTVVFKVVGYFRSSTLIKAFPSIYTTQAAMDEVTRRNSMRDSRPTLVLCQLVQGKTMRDLEALVNTVPQANHCPFYTRNAVATQFRSDTAKNILTQLPMSLSLAFITAVFMLVTVLTTGIAAQRQRIALLRCMGLTRRGTAFVTMLETGMMTTLGWGLGLIAACVFLQLFLVFENSPDLPSIVHLDWKLFVLTGIMAFATAMLASIAPSIQASRVGALEIIPNDMSTPHQVSKKKTIFGVTLLAPMILLALPANMNPSLRTALMVAIGLPSYVAGSVLCLHPLMRFVEVIFLKPIGKLLGLDPALLSRRISRAPERTIGTIMTLSLGLGSFLAIFIWGTTLTACYIPSAEWPDAIVSIRPNGLDAEQTQAALQAEGVAANAVPIEASQFYLDEPTLQAVKDAKLPALKSPLMLVFGVDPEKAFGGDSPVAKFKFIKGNATDATQQLLQGNACLVPEMFTRLTGLTLGNTIHIAGRKLKIAGVLDLNWHLVTSRGNVRSKIGKLTGPDSKKPQPRQNTVCMLFTSETLAREMTANPETTYYLWMNMAPELQSIHPLQAAIRLDSFLNQAINENNRTNGKPELQGSSTLQVHHRDEISDGTIAHGNEIVGTMARIPFWSLIVTSSGIAALLIASAHASRRETCIMRAIGMTRGQLARLFTGEAILVIICAIIVSILGGMLIGWSFTAVTREKLAAGLPKTLIIPWGQVLKGTLFTTGLALLMAALPLRHITK